MKLTIALVLTALVSATIYQTAQISDLNERLDNAQREIITQSHEIELLEKGLAK